MLPFLERSIVALSKTQQGDSSRSITEVETPSSRSILPSAQPRWATGMANTYAIQSCGTRTQPIRWTQELFLRMSLDGWVSLLSHAIFGRGGVTATSEHSVPVLGMLRANGLDRGGRRGRIVRVSHRAGGFTQPPAAKMSGAIPHTR